MNKFKGAADLLFNLRQSGQIVKNLPEHLRPLTFEDGYAIQEAVVEKLCHKTGSHVIGYKVGCTSKDAQVALNVPTPFRGQLLSATTYQSGKALNTADFHTRIIEPEFGFRMGADVPASDVPYTMETIRPYINELFPAIEIASHHFEGFADVTGPEFIADNAIHGVLIMGTPIKNWQETDLAAHLVTLNLNGEKFGSDSGDKVLGHPLNVMAWLANDGQARSKPLKKDQLVISGTVNMIYMAQKGDELEADFGVLGAVSVSFR